MNNLSTYIIEKLYINKSSNVLSDDEKILISAFDNYSEDDKKAFKDWLIKSKSNGNNFDIYVTNFQLLKINKKLKFKKAILVTVTLNELIKEVNKYMPVQDKEDPDEFNRRYQLYTNNETNDKRFDMYGTDKCLLLNTDFEIFIVKQ